MSSSEKPATCAYVAVDEIATRAFELSQKQASGANWQPPQFSSPKIKLGAIFSLSRLLFRPSNSLHCQNELFPLFKSRKTTSRFFKFWAEQFEKISLFFIFAHISLSISIYFFRSSTFLISLIITFFFNPTTRAWTNNPSTRVGPQTADFEIFLTKFRGPTLVEGLTFQVANQVS